ncbi:MAG: glycosyltransferase [Afipia sp.]|nr:glycosyltransferase [Afipia sp.]
MTIAVRSDSSGSPSARSATKPRRMLMIGYNTVDEAVAKGIIRRDDEASLELYYNFGQMFDEVLYIVPFGRADLNQRLTDTIEYREVQFTRTHRGARLALAGLTHVPKTVRFINEVVRQFQPDVVQVCGPHIPAALTLLSKEAWRLPSVCFIEAFWETILPQQQNLPSLIRKVLPNWYRLVVYRRFDRYTGAPSLSPDFYSRLGMDRSKISCWIQPLDLRQLVNASVTDAPPEVLSAPQPRVVVVGRLHPEKLAGDALEIFARAVSPGHAGTLIFIGDGTERAAIEARARELGLEKRIVVTGLLPHSGALAAMKACDYSIAPMQGSALLESLGAGLATVAYDHETHRALIDNGRTGVLVPHRDIAAAAAVLERWLASPSAAKSIGQAAQHQVFDRFSVPNVKEILRAAFDEAFEGRRVSKIKRAV